MFVRDKSQEFQTRVYHIPIEFMIANPLTKAIKTFVDHVTHMSVVKSFIVLG